MSDIKISVPYLPGPLRAAALYLTDLAASWEGVTSGPPVEVTVEQGVHDEVLVKVEDTNFNAVASIAIQEAAAAVARAAGANTDELEAGAGGEADETLLPPDPALVFGAPTVVRYILQGAEYTAEQLETAGYTPEMIQALPLAEVTEAGTGDIEEIPLANGIPWDSRINVSTKTILAKKPNDWKLKRMPKEGYTTETWEAYVESVRAELRQAQAAPANTPQNDDTPPELDFPRLCGLITKHGITDEQLAAACTKVGPIAFAVIGTRPDLIDPLARELGIL